MPIPAVLILALMQAVLAPGAARAACADPPWLTRSVADFHRDFCESRDWVRMVVSGLPRANAELEGRRDTVTYQVNDSVRPPTGIAVARRFTDLFMAMRAAVVSTPDNETQVVAHRPGPFGEVWYLYTAGSGNFDERTSFTVTTLSVQALIQQVQARTLAAPWPDTGCTDPPWLVRGLAAYERFGCDARDWTVEVIGRVPGGDKSVAGRRQVVHYDLRDGQTPMAALAIQRNFRTAFAAIGATVVTAVGDEAQVVATEVTPAGTAWYIVRDEGGNSDGVGGLGLTTVIETAFTQEVEARPLPAVPSTEAPCADPAWLVKGPHAFHRQSCAARDWDMVDLTGLDGDARHVDGRRVTVVYAIAQGAPEPPAILIARNFRNALVAAGARLLTLRDDDSAVIATQTTPAGDVYYMYGGTSGTREGIGGYSLTTLVAQPFAPEVAVRPMQAAPATAGSACAGPPWLVTQFASYRLVDCDTAELAPLTVSLREGERILAGRLISADYALADPRHTRIPVAIRRNYVEALEGIGAKLVSDPLDGTMAVLHDNGDPASGRAEAWYVYRSGGGNAEGTNRYSLQTLSPGGPPPPACVLAVYGVNFDVDQSELRPESEPVLERVLTLFSGDPGFSAEVGSHSDNIGRPAYNLKLSEARAAAVKGWLVSHGVAAARVSSRGYGDTRPLVANATDAGRFRNRRVELKREGCK
jgi:outer membrane protein OmpA-like peptidoglycan-associated protein